MIYALTTPEGRVFEFYVHSCAKLYQGMYGGSLTTVEGEMLNNCDSVESCDQLELI
jgi:hypothetical protein